MVRQFIITLLFTFFAVSTFAQSDLNFYNDMEKNAVESVLASQEFQPLNLFLGVDKKLDDNGISKAAKKFGDLIQALESEGVKTLPEKKAAKLIQKNVKALQTKYVREAEFTQLFLTGEYSATTGTALYALVFDHFDLPYSVRETDKGPYIVAFPTGAAVAISSLPPEAMYLTETESSRTNFVNYLKAHKAVPEDQLKGDVEAVFNKLYYTTINDDIAKVGAQLYYNRGALAMESSKLGAALNYYSKAYALDPSTRNWFWYSNALVVRLSKAQVSDKAAHKMIAQLANLSIGDEPFPEASGAFNVILSGMSANMRLVDQAWETIDKYLKHEPARKEYAAVYWYERARVKGKQGLYREALTSIEKSYLADPDRPQTKNVFIATLVLDQQSGNIPKAVSRFEEYTAKYPFLLEDAKFTSTMANAYLGAAGFYLRDLKLEEGMKYIEGFEAFYAKHPDAEIYPEYAAAAYGPASLLYMDKKNNAEARKLVDRGLHFAPDDAALKMIDSKL